MMLLPFSELAYSSNIQETSKTCADLIKKNITFTLLTPTDFQLRVSLVALFAAPSVERITDAYAIACPKIAEYFFAVSLNL